jgi:hypothetical protein
VEPPANAAELCLAGYWPASPPCSQGLGISGSALNEANRYERQGIHASQLVLGLGCWMPTVAPNPACGWTGIGALGLTVFAARMTLRDDVPPTFEVDDLASLGGAAVRGVAEVKATTVDQGSGLDEMSWVVDGNEGPRQSLADSVASCRPPYVELVPCPSRRELSMAFDSRAVTDGVHTVQVALFDAAGNRGLSAPVSVIVANGLETASLVPGPNGRGATRFARLRAWLAGRSRTTDRTLAYGATTSVEGQLTTSNGTPVRGATLRVEQRAIGVASRPLQIASVTTDAKGRFRYRVARGTSRSLRFTYTAFPGDAGPVASAQVSVHVRAGISLKTSPSRVRNGTVLTFRGRVLGERGTRRAVVTIYALSSGPRKRIPVETFRAAASGKFTYRYRFRSIPGPVTYRFEARVLKQTGFPYVEGASRPVAVRGRP